MSDYLLDTCALLWVAWNHPLSDGAIAALDTTARRHRPVHVSPITAWELGHLVPKKKVTSADIPGALVPTGRRIGWAN